MVIPELIDLVIEQIIEDVKNADYTAIEEMLYQLPKEILIDYLPEEKQNA